MSSFEIIFLAIALAMDACVVSFSQGLIFEHQRVRNSLILAFFVGFFQFIMPLIGGFFTKTVYSYIVPIAPWLVFAIFVALGVKFIKDALANEDKTEVQKCNLCFKYLILIAIATSIDALAAGVSLTLSKTPLLYSSLIIGFVTFIFSLSGFWGGNLFKKFPAKNLEIAGGLILIFLGILALIK